MRPSVCVRRVQALAASAEETANAGQMLRRHVVKLLPSLQDHLVRAAVHAVHAVHAACTSLEALGFYAFQVTQHACVLRLQFQSLLQTGQVVEFRCFYRQSERRFFSVVQLGR